MSKKVFSNALLCMAVVELAATSFGSSITLDLTPSFEPDSGSNAGYYANALNSLQNTHGNIGDRSTDPTAYVIAPAVVEANELMVTSFPSWRGQVNPASPFDNEHGAFLVFGLHAYGDGKTQFAFDDLTYVFRSSDPGNSLGDSGDFVGYDYGAKRIGINWGPDRIPGTADDIVYTSGNGTTLVDEIFYKGVGEAWWPGGDSPDPANPIGGAQAAMDAQMAWVAGLEPITATCTYTIDGYSGSSSVKVVAPEPGTLTLLAIGGLTGLVTMWIRRRRAGR